MNNIILSTKLKVKGEQIGWEISRGIPIVEWWAVQIPEARAMPGILPEMSIAESLDVTHIYLVADQLP